MTAQGKLELATLAGGCFWCLEAVFDQMRGVESVTSGYMGGRNDKPSYKDVCSGNSGHAEVVQIRFDPTQISFKTLLDVFFAIHDPTTLNRQGNDVGTQYRSAIFFHDEIQASTARECVAALAKSGKFTAPIVTEITPAVTFWRAEEYHQHYFEQNPMQPYCQLVVAGKVKKAMRSFETLLK